MKVLVLGGGLSGCTIGYLLRKQGYEVNIIERDDKVGGLCATHSHQGINYEFGPHICYARDNTPAYNLFHELLPEFKPIKYFPKQSMDGELDNLATFPITVANVLKLPEDDRVKAIEELYHINLDKPDYTDFESYIISRVGRTMYEYCYKNYNRKQWGIEPSDMDSEWARFRNFYLRSGDYGMFGDMWQGHPKSYTNFFDRLTKDVNVIHSNIEKVEYNEHSIVKVCTSIGEFTADIYISTLPLDFVLGERDVLAYRAISKLFYHLLGKSGLPTYLCTFPNHYPWTRITDYVLQAEQDADNSLISFAVPHSAQDNCPDLERWQKAAASFIDCKLRKRILEDFAITHRYVYPVSSRQELTTYKRLIAEASRLNNFVTFGRLGLYSYISMCTAINQAAAVNDNLPKLLNMETVERIEFYRRLREQLS